MTEGGRGERLALRPDFTIPVCLYHLSNGSFPMRYAYEGAVFRRSEDGSSERLETGYEDIGRLDRTAGCSADEKCGRGGSKNDQDTHENLAEEPESAFRTPGRRQKCLYLDI